MKTQEQITKELTLYKNKEKELILELKTNIKFLPDEHALGRISNIVVYLQNLQSKMETLKSVLI
jgi:hypothetical protein